MCDCLEKTRLLIVEKTGDPDAYIDVTYNFNNLGQKPAGMRAHYREKKKDGSFKERETHIGISPTFCPFCGVKYDESGK